MSGPLVFIEVRDSQPTPGSLGLIAVAHRVWGTAATITCGAGAAAIAKNLATRGADTSWFCGRPDLVPEVSQAFVDTVADLVNLEGYDTILFENSLLAADVAGGLAARFDAGVNWDLQELSLRDGALVGSRLALDDSVAVSVGWAGPIRIAVFRVDTHEPADLSVQGEARAFEPRFSATAFASTVAARELATSADQARLDTAEIVVAGGRGVRDRESLGILEDLAEALGGVVGASLPIVDRGWYPHSRQIGQTGQRIHPRLYIGCGISGALAHRVGMEQSDTIIAINSDPAAPIFGICDAGVVGDLHEIVPVLTSLIRQARAT